MPILTEQKSHNCTDGRIKKMYMLSEPVNRVFIDHCRDFGGVSVIESLRKPFFTFQIPQRLNIKGIIDEPSIEVWFYPEHQTAGERFLRFLFSLSEPDMCRAVLDQEHKILLNHVEPPP